MLNRTKLLISILISAVVLVAGIAMLIVFISLKSSGGTDEPSPDPDPVHVVDTIDFSNYNRENKVFFVNSVSEALKLNENLYEGLTEETAWLENFLDETIGNVQESFRRAGVDINIFKNVSRFVVDFRENLDELAFDFTQLIAGSPSGNFSFFELFSKTQNLNALLKILDTLYETGITNRQLAAVIYHFIDLEFTTLSKYKFELYSSLDLTPLESIEALQILIDSIIIDGIDLLHEYYLLEPKEQIITTIEGLLEGITSFLNFLKAYNVERIIEVFVMIKDGQIKAEEFSLLVADMRADLLKMVDPDTGKMFSIPKDFYNSLLSVATKIPFVNQLITKWTGFPNVTDAVANIVLSIKNSEDFLNRAFQGLINITEKINNRKELKVINESGQYIAEKSMAQAIIDNVQQIYTDQGIYANADTIIIISKLLSGYFADNALSPTYLEGYLTKNNKMLASIFDMFELESSDSGEYETLNAFKGTLMSISKLINEFAKYDLGTKSEVLIDASPSYVIFENIIDNIFFAIFNQDYQKVYEIVFAMALLQLFPAAAYMLVSLPVIIPLAVVGIGTIAMVSYVAITPVIAAIKGVQMEDGFVFDADALIAGLLAGKSMDEAIMDSTIPENYQAVKNAFAGVKYSGLVLYYVGYGLVAGGIIVGEFFEITIQYLKSAFNWQNISSWEIG